MRQTGYKAIYLRANVPKAHHRFYLAKKRNGRWPRKLFILPDAQSNYVRIWRRVSRDIDYCHVGYRVSFLVGLN